MMDAFPMSHCASRYRGCLHYGSEIFNHCLDRSRERGLLSSRRAPSSTQKSLVVWHMSPNVIEITPMPALWKRGTRWAHRQMGGPHGVQRECVRRRLKDMDFERREITVREGKGMKDRCKRIS